MFRSAASKVMWVGRATVFMVGLSVTLAVVFGVASTALAGNLDPLKIGSLKNVATKTTQLVGKVASGSAFVVKNPSGGSALDLQVNAGRAPLTVNAEAGTATNLSADKLDGKDSGTYLPGDLPAGTTVRGNFYIVDTSGGGSFGGDISFGYRLPSAPFTHYIKDGDPVPAGCSGTVADPEAAPGHLCVFEYTAVNVTADRGIIFPTRQCSGLRMEGGTATGTSYAYGTWAVRAPN